MRYEVYVAPEGRIILPMTRRVTHIVQGTPLSLKGFRIRIKEHLTVHVIQGSTGRRLGHHFSRAWREDFWESFCQGLTSRQLGSSMVRPAGGWGSPRAWTVEDWEIVVHDIGPSRGCPATGWELSSIQFAPLNCWRKLQSIQPHPGPNEKTSGGSFARAWRADDWASPGPDSQTTGILQGQTRRRLGTSKSWPAGG